MNTGIILEHEEKVEKREGTIFRTAGPEMMNRTRSTRNILAKIEIPDSLSGKIAAQRAAGENRKSIFCYHSVFILFYI